MSANSSQPNTQRPQTGNNTAQFCSHCGTKLDVGARFCKNCGETVVLNSSYSPSTVGDTINFSGHNCVPREKSNEITHRSRRENVADRPITERRTVFEGEIHKCPNCGEVLNPFMVNCPACGHKFRGAKVATSVREFASKLETNIHDHIFRWYRVQEPQRQPNRQ